MKTLTTLLTILLTTLTLSTANANDTIVLDMSTELSLDLQHVTGSDMAVESVLKGTELTLVFSFLLPHNNSKQAFVTQQNRIKLANKLTTDNVRQLFAIYEGEGVMLSSITTVTTNPTYLHVTHKRYTCPTC